MLSSYIEDGIGKAFDPVMGFRPSIARNWVNKNSSFLKKYLGEDYFQRVSALSDYGYLGKRFLDEVNPSGTAASLKNMINPGGFVQKLKQGDVVASLGAATVGTADSVFKKRAAKKYADDLLSPNAPKVSGGSSITQIPGQIDKKVHPYVAAGSIGAKTQIDDEKKGGPKKWESDGAKKLSRIYPKNVIDKLQSTVKGRKILLDASSAKAGSKRMKAIMKRIEGMK